MAATYNFALFLSVVFWIIKSVLPYNYKNSIYKTMFTEGNLQRVILQSRRLGCKKIGKAIIKWTKHGYTPFWQQQKTIILQ